MPRSKDPSSKPRKTRSRFKLNTNSTYIFYGCVQMSTFWLGSYISVKGVSNSCTAHIATFHTTSPKIEGCIRLRVRPITEPGKSRSRFASLTRLLLLLLLPLERSQTDTECSLSSPLPLSFPLSLSRRERGGEGPWVKKASGRVTEASRQRERERKRGGGEMRRSRAWADLTIDLLLWRREGRRHLPLSLSFICNST